MKDQSAITDVNKIKTKDDVKKLLDEMSNPSYKNYSTDWLHRQILQILGLEGDKKIRCDSIDSNNEKDMLLIYSLCRGRHQINEACNKLCASIELAYALCNDQKDRVCPSFSPDFSLGTLIPTLYYSVLSSMTSSMCILGVISFRSGRGDNYLLINYGDYWKLIKREEFLQNNLQKSAKGWHEQVKFLYQGLQENDYDLPKIDFRQFEELKRDRNLFHYEILSRVTMVDAIYGIRHHFFPNLSFTISTIKKSLDHMTYLWKDDRRINERFSEILANINKLYDSYGIEMGDEIKK
jgi:hypothetical protein